MKFTNTNRVKLIKKGALEKGPVIYWMSTDQRVSDNWALIFGKELAIEYNRQLVVIFNLVTEFLGATLRQYDFMIKGLKEVEKKFRELNIPFFILIGDPIENVPKFIEKHQASILITDFDPLRIKKIWKNEIAKKITIPFYEVDTHYVVPINIVSHKAELSARTIRPKIHKLLPNFLDDFPDISFLKQKDSFEASKINWGNIYSMLNIDHKVKPVNWLMPGEHYAEKQIELFIANKLEKYSELRNDPTQDATSQISPYLHFGQISVQRIALRVMKKLNRHPAVETFIEELIVRRELAANFCHYTPNYENFDSFPSWAKQTLTDHLNDKREYVYTLNEFEYAKTHDDLWNASQIELLHFGWLNGYLRMYWAKKILEWTPNPIIAQQWAIYLNDKYQLDGRDANGYTGIAWSIGGVHDRPWSERAIFGKIRYMNQSGARRKFDVDSYINKIKNVTSIIFK
ncbi:MAG: deoxyribodipyrimidine photo-lyase [Candidatus Kapaibacteriales bacterium]